MKRILFAVGVLGVCWSGSGAQTTLTLPPGVGMPGVPMLVVLTNGTNSCIDTLVSNVLTLLTPDGDLVTPELVGCGPVSICLSNGQSANLVFTPPALGPGSAGSFVLLCPYGSGAAVRLDVVLPLGPFPDIHTYPAALPFGPGGHLVSFPLGTSAQEWEFSNTAAQATVISPLVEVFTPGGSVPVAVVTLSNLVVPANGVTRVGLPLAGLAAGPYSVRVSWNDPGLGGPKTVRHGIVLSASPIVDLHLPGGHVVPMSGVLPARIAVSEAFFFPPPTWDYLLAVGVAPGSTPLPGGPIAPLVGDPLVLSSLTTGILGLLTGHIGSTTTEAVYCAHVAPTWSVAHGITIAHPNLPSLSGTTFRVGVVAVQQGMNIWAASQPEDITLQ